MPRLAYNLADIPDFVTVGPGRYRAKLRACDKKKSSTGNPMLVWTWEIASGKAKGQSVRSWTSLQEGALGNLKEHLRAFGLKGKVNMSTDKLIGKVVVLVVNERDAIDGSGRKFPNVQSVLPKNAPLGDDEEPDEDEAEDADIDEDDEEDPDDDEDEDEDDEPQARRKPKAKKRKAEVEDDEEDADSDVPF